MFKSFAASDLCGNRDEKSNLIYFCFSELLEEIDLTIHLHDQNCSLAAFLFAFNMPYLL